MSSLERAGNTEGWKSAHEQIRFESCIYYVVTTSSKISMAGKGKRRRFVVYIYFLFFTEYLIQSWCQPSPHHSSWLFFSGDYEHLYFKYVDVYENDVDFQNRFASSRVVIDQEFFVGLPGEFPFFSFLCRPTASLTNTPQTLKVLLYLLRR